MANTQWRVLIACYKAAHYNPADDPGKKYRDARSVERKQLLQIARAARVLANAAGHNHKGLMWAMTHAELNSGVGITRKTKEGSMDLSVVAEKYFRCLDTSLRGPLPEISGGPFLHRFTIGNLHFDKPIRSGRPITTGTMLAFELAIYMRMHTAGHAGDSLQNASPMPDYGDPCFPTVAAFCAATLGTALDGRQTGDNVRKLKDVGLMDWPEPE